jgi:hypothetical protein
MWAAKGGRGEFSQSWLPGWAGSRVAGELPSLGLGACDFAGGFDHFSNAATFGMQTEILPENWSKRKRLVRTVWTK